MRYNPDVLEKEGKKGGLLGNEAIARGALESGLGFSSSYPGTPSSEVGMTLASIAKKAGIYVEWATNEKTAFEASTGAAYCGVNALTAMKHFGLNVASDTVFPVIYTGVTGGFVMVVADDPGGLSSAQSEQDSRLQARLGNIPSLEPSNAQECRDFTKLAFGISKKYKIPVILRTTTRVNHAIGAVKLGKIPKHKSTGAFKKDPVSFNNVSPGLQNLHKRILKKVSDIEREYGKINTVEGRGSTGIITSGVCYEYVRDFAPKNVKIAKLNMSFPISRKFIEKFAKGLKTIIVVEELEPVIEDAVSLALRGRKIRIEGKSIFPRYGEFSPELIAEKLAPILKMKKPSFAAHAAKMKKLKLPTRKPVFCQGCPHRSTFYAAKQVFPKSTVWAGDVGCYVLGMFEPFHMQDFILSMGSGTGVSHGIRKVSRNQRLLAFMGDSTFFHSGMPGIMNVVHNESDPIIVILDNSITAMTGHQTHPASGVNATGKEVPKANIAEIVKSFGIKNVTTANAYSQEQMQAAFKEALSRKGPSVIVASGICRLLLRRRLRSKGAGFVKYEIDQEKCIKCGICSDKYACPAIVREGNKIWINKDICWGCGVCPQLCPVGAIKPEVKSPKVAIKPEVKK
jgi:indolepyruvate ferredoxin oxidoreductase alpha subunit